MVIRDGERDDPEFFEKSLREHMGKIKDHARANTHLSGDFANEITSLIVEFQIPYVRYLPRISSRYTRGPGLFRRFCHSLQKEIIFRKGRGYKL